MLHCDTPTLLLRLVRHCAAFLYSWFVWSRTASLAPTVPLPPPAEKASWIWNLLARSGSSVVMLGHERASALASVISHLVPRILNVDSAGSIGP